MKKGLVVIYQS